FGLALPRPTPGALVLAFADRPRAGPATDTFVTAIEQLVVRHAVGHHVAPGVLARPGRQRIDLHIRLAGFVIVALEDRDARARLRLIAPQPCNPGIEPFDRALRGLDLANRAALIGIRLVQVQPMPLRLLFDRDE